MKSHTFSIISALVATVSAHGIVHNISIADVMYSGYIPQSDEYQNPPPDRIMRPIHSSGPVEDIEISDIQCGGYAKGGMVGSRPANLTAGPVGAGEIVKMFWDLWPDSHVGPAMAYMARCANDDCKTFMPGTDAVWFKIKEAGREGTSNIWTDVTPLTKPGGVYEYTIPPCLQAGAYLVRHEIIALFGAEKYPGAQFYPSCHQIQVTGGGSSTGPAEKVSFPGAYKPTDPGVVFKQPDGIPREYTIPGPPVFSCDGTSTEAQPAAKPATTPAATPATTPATKPATKPVTKPVTNATEDDSCDA
ncbi:hypothetical protein HYFRA_00002544 [Hymenoscyphus fraxineus]|uniref:lytic cellulose monooxygenase (C4-dehydrogenating) n=1 Tax=Hymenoscyphus fraxineus TaxID=746836 RepID=A0A9N9L7Q2_9HELO|nr:hypothetical protein HYFRA_00002544 [Hymenoscyphus fraxineus]